MVAPSPPLQQREQLLKLVSRSFYRELTKYGVARNEILSVTNHLLDNLLHDGVAEMPTGPNPADSLKLSNVVDQWSRQESLSFDGVTLRRLTERDIAPIVAWLEEPEVRDSFVPSWPSDPLAIQRHFSQPQQEYLAIIHRDVHVGIIGAENIDLTNRKLEMRKLIGDRALRGIGIGTRATFAFLYYAFTVLDVNKVYLHSLDTNIQNINLNCHLGFELEGIYLEEVQQHNQWIDVVRMGLLKPRWLAMFDDRSLNGSPSVHDASSRIRTLPR